MHTPPFISSLHTNQRLFVLELLRRGVTVEPVALDLELIRAVYRGREELIFDRDTSLVAASLCEAARNKALAACLLRRAGVSVVPGCSFRTDEGAHAAAFAESLGGPIVLKPNRGSHGDLVFVGLSSRTEVEEAISLISRKLPAGSTFLVESQFNAPEYRLFITRERRFAVLHRDPAHVFGDGFSSIAELVERESYRRMNPRTTCLTPIVVDEVAEQFLRARGISLNDAPSRNEKVYLRAGSNLAKGGTCEDFTDRIHPSVVEIGMLALSAFPGLPYAGVDLLSTDITAPQDESTYRVIEVNPSPGLHMHMRPAAGAPRDVASYLADLIFPETCI